MEQNISIGSIVEMKKQHPCGTNRWEIIRLGMDIKLKCCYCERIVMLERKTFNKRLRKVLEQ